MGFGFNLFFVFVILPISIVLIIASSISEKKIFGRILKFIWIGILGLIILSSIARYFTTKKGIDKEDIYGEYIIDRSKFSGPQADWQYENFRFEITEDHKLIFYQIKRNKIDTAKVEFLEQYVSDRIRIKRNQNMHHIIEKEPTLYRNVWSFYYVFKSPKFGNVFFKKGKWKPIEK